MAINQATARVPNDKRVQSWLDDILIPVPATGQLSPAPEYVPLPPSPLGLDVQSRARNTVGELNGASDEPLVANHSVDLIAEEALKIVLKADLEAAAGGIPEADYVEMLKRALSKSLSNLREHSKNGFLEPLGFHDKHLTSDEVAGKLGTEAAPNTVEERPGFTAVKEEPEEEPEFGAPRTEPRIFNNVSIRKRPAERPLEPELPKRTRLLTDLERQIMSDEVDADEGLSNSQIIEMQMMALETLDKENKKLHRLLERQTCKRMKFLSGVVRAKGAQLVADGQRLIDMAEAELCQA